MLFTLIISTKDRVDEIGCLLLSLEAQSIQDFEIIIADQNEDDRLAAVVDESKWNGRLVRLKSSGGVSCGRNDGLARAAGTFVGFPDDDCRYLPGLLKQVADFFESHPEYGFLSGRSVADDGEDAVSRHAKHASPIERQSIYSQCIEFAFFIRRSDLGPLRFDENLGVGARTPWQSDEGPDLMLRMMERGTKGYYDPQVAVWHPRPVQAYDARAIDRSYRYACGTGYFLRKHRYSLWFFGYLMARTTAGLGLACLTFKGAKARFFWARIRGRWRGWTSYGAESS
jgi:glycosyltransferase involved in cell wall biosynthesis